MNAPTFDVECPANDDTPLLVSVPHAGLSVPVQDEATLSLRGEVLKRDADLFTDRLSACCAALGVPRVVARVSRYVLDLNRAPTDVDHDMCPQWPSPAKKSARGLVWRKSTDDSDVQTRPLLPHEILSRIERLHQPFHATLARLLAAKRERFGFAILLDVHSMPSLGRSGHSDTGERRADVVPGDVFQRSCDARLTRVVIDHFENLGRSVRKNVPYSGGYITQHHGQPRAGVHAIQLELNRALYMDEARYAWHETDGPRLATELETLMQKLSTLRLRE